MKRTTKIKTSMKTIEGKSLEGIPFTLKASHSSKLCSKHCLQLDRMIKRKREEEEASHVVEPAQMLPESQEDSQESQVTKFPTAVSRELVVVKQGRPLKYDDLTRFQLAATAVKGVSLDRVGEVFQLVKSTNFDEAISAKGPSRTVVVQCLIELHACFRYHLAEHLSASESLSLMMDGTSDGGRQLLSIYFGGKWKGEKGEEMIWNLPAGIVELSDHTAITQVKVVQKMLWETRKLQRELGLKTTQLYEIVSLTADNTASNTGENGVRGVLEEARRKQWAIDGKEGSCPPLVFKGCEDHISHLASKETEKRLMIRYKSWSMDDRVDGQHHASSTALMHIMARLRSPTFHRPFRAYVRDAGGKPPAIPRHSETRYASIDTLAKVFIENRGFIILFLYTCRALLTQLDLDSLKVPSILRTWRSSA